MSSDVRERAAQPEDLNRLIVERFNAVDVGGLVALYEPDAVLALPNGQVATGATEIRQAYEDLVVGRPAFALDSSSPPCGSATWPARRCAWSMAVSPSRWLVASPTAHGCGPSTIPAS